MRREDRAMCHEYYDYNKEELLRSPKIPMDVLPDKRAVFQTIAPETRAANAIGDFGGRLEDMPHWCVTIGFREIYQSRKLRLGIFRDWHRAVARRCGYGEMTPAFPVSLVADHPDVLLRMTEFVANLED